MLCPDVNVLIYAHRREAPEHAAYADWLRRAVEGPEPLGISELVLCGFQRIVTRRRVFKDPTPVDVALEFTRHLASHPNVRRLRPGPRHFDLFQSLVRDTGATGKLVADAYHAALALEHGCTWVTADGDFQRFPSVRTTHPLRVAPT